MKYIVYVKPSAEILRVREQLLTDLGSYNLGVASLEPHCTIMTNRFHEAQEKEIISRLKQVVIPQLHLRMNELALFDGLDPHCKALVARVSRMALLQKLHEVIIRGLASRIVHEELSPLSQEYSTGERKRVYAKYGSPFVEKFYNPHITICDVAKDTDIDAIPNYFKDLAWTTASIILAKKKEEKWEYIREFVAKK